MTDTTKAIVEQRHRDVAAAALGYRDWEDAIDYCLTGRQVQERDALVQSFARFEAEATATLAARVDALEAENAELREALQAFVNALTADGKNKPNCLSFNHDRLAMLVRIAARATLTNEPKP